MGACHLQAYQGLAGAEVAAVCSQDGRKLAGDLSEVGGNLNQPQANYDFSGMRKYKRWEEMVADPQLDAIDICLPTDMHASVSVAALERWKARVLREADGADGRRLREDDAGGTATETHVDDRAGVAFLAGVSVSTQLCG